MAVRSKAPIGAGLPNGVGAPAMPKSLPTLTLSQPGLNWGNISGAIGSMGSIFGAIGTGRGSKNAWMSGGLYDTTSGTIARGMSSLAGQFNSPIAQGIGLAMGAAGNMIDMYGYNPEVEAIDNRYSSDYAPSFDLTDERQTTNEFVEKVRSDTSRKVLSTALQGAAAGAAFSPLGGLIGGAVGLVGGLFGKKRATNRAIEAQREMQNEYSSAVGRFNKAHEGYYGKENAAERYQAKLMSRGYNVPNASPYLF